MGIPTDGQTAADALKHVDQGHITGLIAWILGGMASLIAVLLGWDRLATKKSVATLFRWKDNVVDPALKEFPEKYMAKPDCNRRHDEAARRHDEMLELLRTSRREQQEENHHLRRLLERHLGVNGDGP